jgi:hypothetical protein
MRLIRGGLGALEMGTNIFGADNFASDILRGAQEGMTEYLISDTARIKAEERAQRLEGEGFFGTLGAVPGLLADDPGLLFETAGTVAASLIPAFFTKGASLAAQGATLFGTGAAMGAGAIKGSIYDATRNELINAGMPQEEAERAASEAQSYAGENLDMIALGGVLGGIASRTGIEPGAARLIAGRILGRSVSQAAGRETLEAAMRQAAQQSAQRGIVRTTAAEAGLEGAQGAQEQFAANLALQRQGMDVDLMEGVGSAAALEGTLGGILGAGFEGGTAAARAISDRRIARTPEFQQTFEAEQARLYDAEVAEMAAENPEMDSDAVVAAVEANQRQRSQEARQNALAMVRAQRAAAAQQGEVDPEAAQASIDEEYLRGVTAQVEALRAQNPRLTQRQAFDQVMRAAPNIYDATVANLLFGGEPGTTEGGVGAGTTGAAAPGPRADDAGLAGPVGGGAVAGVPPVGATELPGAGVAPAGGIVGGRVGQPVAGLPVSDVGAGAQPPALVEPTAAQVKATVPTITKAFNANRADLEYAYGVKTLSPEQKKQAARIVIQSPEVDPYDAIGSVLERGQRLRGEKLPMGKRPGTQRTVTTINGVPTVTEGSMPPMPPMPSMPAPTVQPTVAEGAVPPTGSEAAAAPTTAVEEELTARDQDVSQELLAPEVQTEPTVAETATMEGIAPEGEELSDTDPDVVQAFDRLVESETAAVATANPGVSEEAVRAHVEQYSPLLREAAKQQVREQRSGVEVSQAPEVELEPTATELDFRNAAMDEAQARGLDAPMFAQGALDAQRNRGMVDDRQILTSLGPDSLTSYKAGAQWGQSRTAETQAAPAPKPKKGRGKKAAATAEPEQGTLFDIPENTANLVNEPRSTDIMALAEELPEPVRVNIRARLARIMAQYAKDNDVGRLLRSLEELLADVTARVDRNRAKRELDRTRGRVRGFERAMEVLYRAERTGQLTPEAANLARWLLQQNPRIADELALSLRLGGAGSPAGQYSPVERLATIFTSRANDGTAAHEILHHAERLMPEKVREGIRAAWAKRIRDLTELAERTGNTNMREVLGTIVRAYYGDAQAQQELLESFNSGTIPYSVYHLSNPSEFWAVNATDLIGKRAARSGWTGAARNWIEGLIERVKDLFGFTNDSAIITGLKAIMAAESGTIQGQMLSARTKDFLMYAGEGAKAANRSKLTEAQALEAAGALSGPTGTTRAKTGWFRGVDGKWRFEIDDRAMTFKPGHTPAELNEDVVYRIGDVIDHPALFEQYPDLQDINFRVTDAGGAGGYWDWRNNLIVVSKDEPKTEAVYLDTLVHELQHAVQTWEGFANGASGSSDYPLSIAALRKALGFLDRNMSMPLYLWDRWYAADALRTMRDTVKAVLDERGDALDLSEYFLTSYNQRYNELLPIKRQAEREWWESDHPEAVRFRELRDARMALGAELNYPKPDRTPQERTALADQFKAASEAEDAQYKYARGMIDTGVAMTSEERELLKDMDFAKRTVKEIQAAIRPVGASKLMYYLTSGEVEARDAEQRRSMSEEERGKVPPYVGERFGELSSMINVDRVTGIASAPPKGPPQVVANGKPVVLTAAQRRTALAKAKAHRDKMNRIQKRIAATNNTADLLGDGIELAKLARGDETTWALLRGMVDTLSSGKWRVMLPLLSTEDIYRILKGRLPGLTEADRLIRNDIRRFETLEYLQLSGELEQISAFLKKHPKAAQALSDLEFATVAYQVDPSKADTAEAYFNRVDGKAKELRAEIKAEKDSEKKKRLERKLDARRKEIESIYKGVPGDEGVFGWNDLNRSELGNGKGKEIFKLIRDAHRRDLEAKYEALRSRLKETKDGEALASALKKLEAQFKPALDQVIYFPAMRFGSYYARVGTGANSIFKMFDSELERNQFRRVMEKQGETITDYGNVEDLRNQFDQVTGGPLKEVLDLFDGNTKDIGALKGQVFDLWLRSLSAGDMRKHMAPRQMRAGYSTDILKNFANFRRSSISDLKRAKYGYKLRTEISRAKDAAKEMPNRDTLENFINEIELRALSDLMPPDRGNRYLEGAIQLGTKMAFYQYLATPSAAVIQLSQLHIVALPILAQKYGHAKATAALAKYGFSGLAGFAVSPFTAVKKEDGGYTFDWQQPNLRDNPVSTLKQESDPQMYEVMSEGWQEATDLGMWQDTFANEGGFGSADPEQRSVLQDLMKGRVHTAAWRGTTFAFEAMGALMHQMERINREATYMATLELEYRENKKKRMSHEKAKKAAIEAAKATLLEATFDFSAYNKPRVLTTAPGRVAGQFYSFPYMMSSLFIRKWWSAIAKSDLAPEEKAAARFVAIGTSVNLFAYAGLTGLPIYGILTTLASMALWIFDGEDEEEEGGLSYIDENGNLKATQNINWWFRNVFLPRFLGPDSTVQSLLGYDDDTAALVVRSLEVGPISAITDVNLANSTALDFMFFLPNEPRFAQTTPQKVMEYGFSFVFGAAGNVVMDYIRAGMDLANGYTGRALERALPRLYGNPIKAQRFAEEGQLNYNRELVGMDEEFWSSDKAIIQAFGWTSTEASQRQRQNYEGRNITMRVEKARNDMMAQIRRVALDKYQYGDTPEVRAAEQQLIRDWVEFNRTYPTHVIGLDSLYEVQNNAVNDAVMSRATRGVPLDERGKTPYLRDIYLERLRAEQE